MIPLQYNTWTQFLKIKKNIVRKVIHALGWTRLFASESQYWTPDRKRQCPHPNAKLGGDDKNDKDSDNTMDSSLLRLRKTTPLSAAAHTIDDKSTLASVYEYPTKLNPNVFFDSLLASSSASAATTNIVLIDDSSTILGAIENKKEHIKMRGIHVNHRNQTLLHALCLALHWVGPEFHFSAERYLRCKNVVDVQSLHRPTWQAFVMSVVHLVQIKVQQQQQEPHSEREKGQKPRTTITSLTVVDVGAGLLSMLGLMMLGGDSSNNNNNNNIDRDTSCLPSLWQTLEEHQLLHQLSQIDYYAYEPNRELQVACTKVLQALGFELQEQRNWDAAMDRNDEEDHNLELIFVRKQSAGQPQQQQPLFTVYLRFWDYEQPIRQQRQQQKQQQPSPDVIVGCCFADLVASPNDLVRSLYRCFLSKPAQEQHQHLTGSAIVYFPITFSGTTQLLPPHPLERHDSMNNDDAYESRVIPSDTTAFALYARALEEQHGHNLDPTRLEDAMKDHGAELLSHGRSDWVIEPSSTNAASPSSIDDDKDYLWQTMMYFFGTTACPQIQVEGLDATAWIRRARLSRAIIRASNVDLLFRAPFIGHWKPADVSSGTEAIQGAGAAPATVGYDEIQFTAPNAVTTIHKPKKALKGNQVRVQSICSLISSVSHYSLLPV
jgi:hypothetical protein